MLKKNKKTLIITSIITILPILFGIAVWDQLPEKIATHFAADGTPNGWSSKFFAVVGLPLFLLFVQWVCIAATVADPKRNNIGDKMFKIICWIVPVVSLFVNASVYLYELGMDVNISIIAGVLVGLIFIIIGNYLPKSRQSYTVGIKLPWTLENEDNWNRTHRMAGWLWIVCGIIMCINAFLQISWIYIVIIVVAIAVPTIYSFMLYKKS